MRTLAGRFVVGVIAGFWGVMFVVSPGAARAAEPAKATYAVGVSAIDVTPDYPIRLSGFGFRRTESEGVTQKIWAKAIAIGADDAPGGAAVIVTVDSTGVPDTMRREVAERLAKKAKLDPARFAITASHTHTAPMLAGVLRTLFGRPVTADEQNTIDRYTRELTDHIEKAALAALADRKPATLEFGIGTGSLAMNRRDKAGPTDHDLPVLVVRGEDGNVRAVYLSYACHCVTLSHNKIGGDWAGYVQSTLQETYPSAIAMTSIGCGADQNPTSGVTGDKVDVAIEQGKGIAAEVSRLIKANEVSPVAGPVATKANEIELMFDTPPTREQYQKVVDANQEYYSYYAKVQIDRLDRGEALQTKLPYLIQTFTFGTDLAMVFLPGEVVVDYSLRLKKDFDRSRLWINAYSNDVPCYIPSERVLKQGGYEGAGAMTFYDRPTKLAPGLEQKIVDEVHKQLPKEFLAPQGTEGVAPKSPQASLRSIRVKEGLEVELVAAEPLVNSPVAIDWGADGKLWVCEMYDYPTGADNNWQPGGRVKFLTDTDGDGKYDKSTLFLDKLAFPTGVTAWGKGVLVCAAPDILYAEDTDNDGVADKIEKRFTGFATDNYQARVNGIALGLDNWLYAANGLLGGVITSPDGKTKIDIRSSDIRFKLPTGPMETVTGLTQQGRVRDDWGNWFGNNNSVPLQYYPHEARYLARNPAVPAPPAAVFPLADHDASRVYPISRTVERFNHPESANRVTAGCGLGIYRDTLLGDGYYGNAFLCEPVGNVVNRTILTGEEPNLKRTRAEDEKTSDFLASTDHWFRPVQAKAGPDGALYVVDMYRFLIEHPRWIPADRMAKIDARAGSNMGRIYRVKKTGSTLRDIADLTKLDAATLARQIDSPSGTERDRVHAELLVRQDKSAIPTLESVAKSSTLPQVRVQALAAIDGLNGTTTALLQAALKDADAQVRKHAVRIAENVLRGPASPDVEPLGTAILALADDASPVVARQFAYTLGEWNDRRAGETLAKLTARGLADAETRTAVLSSAGKHTGTILRAVLATPAETKGRDAWIAPLVATAAASDDPALLGDAALAVLPTADVTPTSAHFAVLTGLLQALDAKQQTLADRLKGRAELTEVEPRVKHVLAAAGKVASDESAKPADRASAATLLGYGHPDAAGIDTLCKLAATSTDADLRAAAAGSLRRQQSPDIATKILAQWRSASPSARGELVNLLLARGEWSAALLASIRDGKVQRNEISLTDRQRLLTSDDEKLRADATATFPPDAAGGSRDEVVARYANVPTLTGDAGKGRELFAANCAACHKLGDVGFVVGPDLALIRDKDAAYWVKNVLDPSAIVEPRFVNYQVVTKDRRIISGIITAETPTSLTLLGGSAVTETVNRSDVKEIRASAVSMMPEGLEGAIDPQQMADLVAFLRSGSTPAKQIPGNSPAVVKASPDGSLLLAAKAAEIRGNTITFEPQFENIGYWHGADDHAAWAVNVDKPGEYDVYLDYACETASAGNAFQLATGTTTLDSVVKPTGADWSTYKQVKLGKLTLAGGEQRVSVRPAAAPRGALIDLRAVALVPAGLKPKWPARAAQQQAAASDGLARDPESVAAIILDASRSAEARDTAINVNPQFAAELIPLMTRDLPEVGHPDALKVEYERIPWIWRVSILAGKRNDAETLRKMLDASLPKPGAPLRDWEAVVIGGGVINGISQRGEWPADRITQIIGDDRPLAQRWTRSIELSAKMADDTKVKPGTRYDALRMLGMEPWEKRGEHLARYLKDTNAELQMGAVSGLADVNSPRATAALLDALPTLTEGNRRLALAAMMRGDERLAALLDAVEAKKIDVKLIDPETKQSLSTHTNVKIRERAAKVVGVN